MRNLIILILSIPVFTFGQDSSIIRISIKACNCLYEVSTDHQDKYDFNIRFNRCLDSFFNDARKIDSTLNSPEEFNHLIHFTLKNNCPTFHYIDSIKSHYNTVQSSFIVKTSDCQLFKYGDFLTEGDVDSVIIEIRDTIQYLRYRSGNYTKSKVTWLGPCSYKLTVLENTEIDIMNSVKPGVEKVFRITAVNNNKIFNLELLSNGKTYPFRMIRIK